VSTSEDAQVDSGDSHTNDFTSDASGSESAGFGKSTNSSGNGNTGSDAEGGKGSDIDSSGNGGSFSDSGSGGASQVSGGNSGTDSERLEDFEPRNENSVSSTPRPVCPETPPTDGAECSNPDLWCGYGTDLRADCREMYVCESDGIWTLRKGADYQCTQPADNACPQAPIPGASCSLIDAGVAYGGIVCEYDGFVLCTCSFEQRIMQWQCFDPPGNSRCPPVLPNYGEGCDIQALNCTYGDPCLPSGATVFCRRGAWEEGYAECFE